MSWVKIKLPVYQQPLKWELSLSTAENPDHGKALVFQEMLWF